MTQTQGSKCNGRLGQPPMPTCVEMPPAPRFNASLMPRRLPKQKFACGGGKTPALLLGGEHRRSLGPGRAAPPFPTQPTRDATQI